MNLLSLIVVSLIGEAVWETLKMVWQKGKLNCDKVGALVIGILLSISTGTDILCIVGINTRFPYIGVILTGILISRGANFIHDLVSSVNNIYQKTKDITPK